MRSEISIDTSIVLAYLLVEDRWPADALWERALTVSRLVECEIWIRLHARDLAESRGTAARAI